MADEDEELECPECPKGLPAWLATFGDLMSLLMCFFVLLLSFAEMDALKFKRLAGELRMAFGVQTVINADDPPKGTSVIAKHFSPSIPEPTPINEIRQKTSDVTKSSLEVLCQDAVTSQEESQGDEGKKTRDVVVPVAVPATPEKVEEQALEMASELEQEISKGQVELETQGSKIIIRIDAKGSFKAGSAYVQDDFLPVLDRIREVLVEVPGRISVEGHTDNSPLGRGAQFSSNWVLSAARAASVAEQLFIAPEMNESRFVVVGHGHVRPLIDNKTAENRIKNRRVEIIIIKSDENDTDDEAEINNENNPFEENTNASPEDFELDLDEIF